MAETTADDAVVANMQKTRANAMAGRSHAELLGTEMPDTKPVEPPPTLPKDVQMVADAYQVMHGLRPAEQYGPLPPPGLTERGWSPEVTSRHPELVAQEMDAMLAELPSGGETEPVDPNDLDALAAAQTELGFAEVRMNNLRVAASNRINDRLWEGISNAGNARASARAALEAAAERARAAIEQFRTDHPPAPTPTPAPTPPSRSPRSTPPTES